MVDFVALIPARLHSTRLPQKPLADIAGKPMVVRVAERARLSGATRVVIATDHASIAEAASAHGVECVMTDAAHPTGTDRLAQAVALLDLRDDAIAVNVQGDEPLIDPQMIAAVAALAAATPDAAIATAAHPIHALDEIMSPNVVKAVTDARGMALYFSRAPIPFARDALVQTDAASRQSALSRAGYGALRHVGIYAYRVSYLRTYAALAPAPAEQWEALEQLRALHHGYRIAVLTWNGALAPGVDTPEDLERVRRFMSGS